MGHHSDKKIEGKIVIEIVSGGNNLERDCCYDLLGKRRKEKVKRESEKGKRNWKRKLEK